MYIFIDKIVKKQLNRKILGLQFYGVLIFDIFVFDE